ncbi:MAG: SLBB domain-containing protein [Deltaproteobacteria bacterium]|jgi:polysaccharide export outer membrane protein|nr:SLBB domain-containing protein [Deltaproteobacteria bacterium]
MGLIRQPNSVWLLIIALLTVPYLAGCSIPPQVLEKNDDFEVDPYEREIPFANPEVIRAHEANLKQEYRIGPGDQVRIEVWNRERLTGEHVVGPYGKITLPMTGVYEIGGLNRDEAAGQIKQLYQQYYEDPLVTVKILKYLNNKVYVLGRVSNPGVIHFNGDGTLLEALSLAGGLPTRDKTIFLSKCYIVRGKEQIIWIDLLQLLQKANIKLNIRLANNDIIYIPESMDAAIFMMGEVQSPGAYQIQSAGLTLMDAINLAGGPTENGNINKVRLIREMKEEKGVKIIDLENILAKGDFAQNYLLRDDDIIYIPRKGMATFNYYLRQIDPFIRTFLSGAVIYETVIKDKNN